MSKRSPFWRAFTAHTPLGYTIAGQFNTEPGPAYGTLRFTHVDGLLPRPYMSPPLPRLQHPDLIAGPRLPVREGTIDIRAVERLDGTLIGFYPLFNGDGALVEVAPRTMDTVVVADTPWRPLAELVNRARHAGIEEAVRRQRAIFTFMLAGSANPRLVAYPFELRLVLHSVLRGNGRTLATYVQMRGWANQYGLDLPETRAEFDPHLPEGDLVAQVTELVHGLEAENAGRQIGQYANDGLMVWSSGRSGAEVLDWPVRAYSCASLHAAPVEYDAAAIWRAMARLADEGVAPTKSRTVPALPAGLPDGEVASLTQTIEPEWDRWARAYPEAFPAVEETRLAV